MSTARIIAILGLALLLTGCVPASGIKTLIAVIAMVISVGAAAWGMSHCREEDKAVKKGEMLDRKVAEHTRRYHG